jgi:hypothetical protein
VREAEELGARRRVLAEHAAQRARDGHRVLLLDPAHHHAHVRGLDHDAHAARAQHVVERPGDLLGEPLLHLQAAREHVDHAGELREADDAPVRDVGDVRLPEERQQVVLAERVQLDLAHHHHLLAVDLEQRVADDAARVEAVAAREERHRLGDAGRRLDEAVALGVLAEQLELARASASYSARRASPASSARPPGRAGRPAARRRASRRGRGGSRASRRRSAPQRPSYST